MPVGSAGLVILGDIDEADGARPSDSNNFARPKSSMRLALES